MGLLAQSEMGKTEPQQSAAPAAPEEEASAALERLVTGGLRTSPAAAWTLFDRAWSRLTDRLSTFLRSLRVPEALREDCAQATLTRAWRARASYRGSSADEFFAWLHRICQREYLRLADRESRLPKRHTDLVDGDEQRLPEPSSGDTTAQAVESRDQARALEDCIAALADLQRRAVELLYAASPSTEREAALVLEVSKSYVNVVRGQALESLARCLERKGVD